jgi:ribosomal protein L25 (general stress protein Ctc)
VKNGLEAAKSTMKEFEMKKYAVLGLAAVAAGALLFTACGSAPKGTGEGSATPAPKAAKTIERLRLDYKGAAVGAEIPVWVEAAIDNDYDAIARISRFKGKVPIINYGSGQNLDLLRSWVNNFSIQAQVARQISNYVEANFGGEQLGSKDTPANRQFIKEVVATFSNVTINGLSQDLDYWVQLRTIDHTKNTETEEYVYYVVYSIKEEDLNYQIAQAMGKISAASKEQEELKVDVEDAMKKAALKGIQSGQ